MFDDGNKTDLHIEALEAANRRLWSKASGRAATIQRLMEDVRLSDIFFELEQEVLDAVIAEHAAQVAIARIDQAHLRYERRMLEERVGKVRTRARLERDRAVVAEAERDHLARQLDCTVTDLHKIADAALAQRDDLASRLEAALDALHTVAERIGEAGKLIERGSTWKPVPTAGCLEG